MLPDHNKRDTLSRIHRNYKYKRLLECDFEENGREDNDSIELMNRGSKNESNEKSEKPFKVLEYDTLFERPIQHGESLVSISLKYRISVSDLKRVNKLHKEVEFYALSTLKIPVKNDSILYEVLQEECSANDQLSSNSLTTVAERVNSSSELESEVDMPVGVISISQICREKKTSKEAKQFLLNMQNDLKKLQEKTNSYKGSLDEAAASLTNISFSPLEKKRFACSGADWGLSWWKILIIGGLFFVGVPFLYVLIFAS